MDIARTPNFDRALYLGMGGGYCGFYLAVHLLLLQFGETASIGHFILVAVLSLLITFGTIVFGVYYLVLRFLLHALRIANDPYWVMLAMPLASFALCFIALHGFWKLWLWL